jgi:WD40 repeat protein
MNLATLLPRLQAIRTALACLLLLGATSDVLFGQESRTWSDRTGKFKIEGKLLGVESGKAKLERKDGSVVQIDVTKLSAADQKFIKEQEEANPFEPAEDNPFKPTESGSSGKGSSSTADSGSASPGELRKVKVDWSESETIALTPTSDEWKFQVPISRGEATPLKTRAIPVPPKSNFFEGARSVVTNASGQRAIVGYTLDEPKPEGTTRIVLADLVKGKTLVAKSTSGKMTPLALNDKGFQVLMRKEEFGFGNQDRLELWNLTPTGITKVLQWTPHDNEKGGDRDVKWAAFLDDDRFVTLGANGKLAVWNAQSATPQFHLQIDGGSVPALSPDRKLIAFSTGKQIGVLDVAAKEVVALQATSHTPWPRLCFSPDASKLACSAHGKLFVWNFGDGTLYREIPLTGTNVHGNDMIWPHDKYLLLGKASLFDIENQVRLWTYRGHELVESIGNQAIFVVSDGQERPGAMVIANIPAPGFTKALEKAMQLPDFFVLKEGVTVKVNVDALPDAAEREKVREALGKKLKERGFQVGPQGTIELVAATEAGKEQEISYHGFGISPWKSYKVRDYISRLTFVYQGQNTWQTQGSSVPGFISLKEGETIDQVLRRSERPNYSFFENVELPKVLMKPMGADGLGASQVSIAGVQ